MEESVPVNVISFVSSVICALQLTPDDTRIPGYPWLLLCRLVVASV